MAFASCSSLIIIENILKKEPRVCGQEGCLLHTSIPCSLRHQEDTAVKGISQKAACSPGGPCAWITKLISDQYWSWFPFETLS